MLSRIARKLTEHRQLMLNLGIQLLALYEGRREGMAGLLEKLKKGVEEGEKAEA
jgi:hypothetical protein